MGVIPFLCIQLLVVGVLIAFPGIVSGAVEPTKEFDPEAMRLQLEASMPEPFGFDDFNADVQLDDAGNAQ